jgi:hypothetical protein
MHFQPLSINCYPQGGYHLPFTRRSCDIQQQFSLKGVHILAQGRAKRPPWVVERIPSRSPEGAEHPRLKLVSPLQGFGELYCGDPGRALRSALGYDV